MRHIDMQELEEFDDWPPGKQPDWERSPEKWRERLYNAEEELRKASDSKTRRAIFKKYSDLWSAVKEHYRALSHDKCWYCETSTHRMNGEIYGGTVCLDKNGPMFRENSAVSEN